MHDIYLDGASKRRFERENRVSIATALKELSDARKKIEEEAREKAKIILAPGLQEFMVVHPDIESITWTQYTPYFNDGEECVFGLHGFDVAFVNGKSHYVSSYRKDVPAEVSPDTWKDVCELRQSFSTSLDELEAAFGDHCEVTVTQEGVDVEEHEHE